MKCELIWFRKTIETPKVQTNDILEAKLLRCELAVCASMFHLHPRLAWPTLNSSSCQLHGHSAILAGTIAASHNHIAN